MKTEKIILTASARVKFSPVELRALENCSRAHYDPLCRNASAVGGIIHGMNNSGGHWTVTTRDVDLLCKILEMPNTLEYLRGRLAGLFSTLNARYQEIEQQ